MNIAAFDEYLPRFAELRPEMFFSELKKSFHANPSQFEKVLAQMTVDENAGYRCMWLVNTLEALAWDENNFETSCLLLAKLANFAPKQHKTSSPLNSLIKILLAWSPQTHASVEKRKSVIRKILHDHETIGWKMLLMLLSTKRSQPETYKPKWVETDLKYSKVVVSNEDFLDQHHFCAELAVEQIGTNAERIAQLIEVFEHLPEPAFNNFVDKLNSETIESLNGKEKRVVWNALSRMTLRFRQNLNRINIVSYDDLKKLESIAEKIAPSDPVSHYEYLFIGDDSNLLSDPEYQMGVIKELENQRKTGVMEIIKKYGVSKIVELLKTVATPVSFANAAAELNSYRLDGKVFPDLIGSDDWNTKRFIHAYVRRRQRKKGWEWVDKIDTTSWTIEQKVEFLTYLPIGKSTLDRAASWLQGSESSYLGFLTKYHHFLLQTSDNEIRSDLTYEEERETNVRETAKGGAQKSVLSHEIENIIEKNMESV